MKTGIFIKRLALSIVALTSLLMVGCAGARVGTIAKGPAFDASTKAVYMVLPFADANEPQFRRSYENASSVVKDAMETSFLEQGFRVKSCPQARASDSIHSNTHTIETKIHAKEPENEFSAEMKTKSQSQFGERGITEEQAIEIGKSGNADFVVMGVVTAFYRGAGARHVNNYTTVGFSAKAIDVNTGLIAWKASLTRKVGFKFDYDPVALAQKVSKEIIAELSEEQ